jgi:betaine-aldehyde dehydrogenase
LKALDLLRDLVHCRSQEFGGSKTGGMGLRQLRNFVGGKYVEALSGSNAQIIDPSTGEAIAEAPVSGVEDIDRAFNAASKAFGSLRRSTPSERALALLPTADTIESRAEEFVRAECENTGKPPCSSFSRWWP